MTHAKRWAIALLSALGLGGCAGAPSDMRGLVEVPAKAAVTVPITLDGGQILVPVDFDRPEGGSEAGLALLNMGLPKLVLKQRLYHGLGVDQGRAATFDLAGRKIIVAAAGVEATPDTGALDRQIGPWFFAHRVDAAIQAGVLDCFELVLDYRAGTLTLAAPGSLSPAGQAVPIRLNDRTGLVTVDAVIDGRIHAMVLDAGSPYSWVRGSTASVWRDAHPDWLRAEGAIGPGNYNMTDYAFEKQGTMFRLPALGLGPLTVTDVGVLGTGPLLGWPGDALFGELVWDDWQKDAPQPVVGWIGANVLKRYRVTIDYANRMSYWLPQDDADPDELDQVGVTLVYHARGYRIGGIVRRNGAPTVAGLEEGDELVEIDGVAAQGLSRDAILSALHGRAGASHRLQIARAGRQLEVTAPVTGF